MGRALAGCLRDRCGGQSVYLETVPSQDSVDRFGRTLAYVWTASGRLFNLDMIADAALLGGSSIHRQDS